jgi:hypothetical protein
LPPIRRASLLKNVTVGRRINKSAANAASMANALSQPNRRSDGKSEKTVTIKTARKHKVDGRQGDWIALTHQGDEMCVWP